MSLNDPTTPLTSDEYTRAKQLLDAAYETSYRDPSPLPPVGTAPPVAQPGRPPMSQRATDASALMLSGGVASLGVGAATSLVLYTLGQVDPVTLAVGAAGPVALVLAVGSLIRSVGRAKADSAPRIENNSYNAPVHQETTHLSSTTKGLFARTTSTGGAR